MGDNILPTRQRQQLNAAFHKTIINNKTCLLYTSDAADDTPCVDLGGRRIIKKNFFQAEDGIRDRLSLVGSEMCIRDSPCAG